MQARLAALLLSFLSGAGALAGCAGLTDDEVTAPEWNLGDVRVYRKEGSESGFFTKRVSGQVAIDGQEAHEVVETRTYSPLVSRSYWALGSLRLLRQDFVEGGRLVGQETYRGDSRVFYHFPLEEGRARTGTFTVETTRGGYTSTQEARWTLSVGQSTTSTVAGKVWEVVPYTIEHRFPGQPPGEDWQRVEGRYAPALGDWVLLVTEGPDYRNTYSLVEFRQAEPEPGLPLYRLATDAEPVEVTGPLRFHAELEATHGYLYTKIPQTLAVRVTEARSERPERGVTWVTLRPAGALGADLADFSRLPLSSAGFLHLALSGTEARVDGGERVLVDRDGERILLVPGQVYEVTLASSHGAVTLDLGSGRPREAPHASRHAFQVLELESKSKARDPSSGDPGAIAAPGPQRVVERERITVLAGPPGRVETLVAHRVLPVEQPVPDVARAEGVSIEGAAGTISGPAVFYAEWGEATGEPVIVRSAYAYEADLSVDGRYAREFTVVSLWMAEA